MDLAQLARERTDERWHTLDDGAGALLLLLTVTANATTSTDSTLQISDSDVDASSPLIGGCNSSMAKSRRTSLARRYDLCGSFWRSHGDVGTLSVKG